MEVLVNIEPTPENVVNIAVTESPINEFNIQVNITEDITQTVYQSSFIIKNSDSVDGFSAYQIWLNMGNIGTQEDFLEYLQGPQGEGLPSGGDTDQVLLKASSRDYESMWSSLPSLTLIFENKLA